MGYGKASREAVENAPVGGGADFWNPPEGESRIRVMPPWNADVEEFWFATATHFNVGPDERAVACPDLSGVSDSCYICRLVKRLSRGDEDERAESDAMNARPRYLLSIVDLGSPQNGVQVWPAPKTIFRQLKKFWLNEEDYGDFTSFKDGFDILVEKTGTGLNTRYDCTPTRSKAFPSDRLLNHASSSVADMFEALDNEEYELPNLAEVQSFGTDEEMERTYKGLSSGPKRTESKTENGDNADDEDEDDRAAGKTNATPDVQDDEETEEKPTRRRRREEPEEDKQPTRRRRTREEPAEEEAAEEEAEREREEASEDGDGEDEEKPRKKSSKDSKESGEKTGRSRIRGRVKQLD